MLSPNAYWKSLQSRAERNWPLLSALGYAFAFAVMAGGVALAAYNADFAGPAMALALGGIAIWLMKHYARGIRATQRLIDRLHPPAPDQVASPDGVPLWASLLYMLLFVALMLSIGAPTNIDAVLGWAAGNEVLAYFFARQSDPTAASAFAVIDDALDRWAEPHRPLLRTLGTALGFAALAGGVALQAFHAGFAGAIAPTVTPIATAIACGALAIVFAYLFVAVTLAAQRALIDPWRYVRPEPPSRDIERWPLYLFALIGVVLFLAMSLIGGSALAAGSANLKLDIGTIDLFALLVGWIGGGRVVLPWFWAKARERAERKHARA
jgi:hypothetical protein